MQTLEMLKSQGQANLNKVLGRAKERPEDVKVWAVTAGSAAVGAVAVNAAARGVVAILAAITAPPVAMTIGALGGAYWGWQYANGLRSPIKDSEQASAEIVVEAIPIQTANMGAALKGAGAESGESNASIQKSAVVQPDDLKKINGIGPVYEGHLHAAGIQTFAQLAELSAAQIRQILEPIRSGHMIEPTTWIAEARQLAATD
ncbi:MAG: hypothetical protein KDE47_21045 [Caldilineaceae bacterium]|nr:hypothetical protein [Caldilineaceae bacterium]